MFSPELLYMTYKKRIVHFQRSIITCDFIIVTLVHQFPFSHNLISQFFTHCYLQMQINIDIISFVVRGSKPSHVKKLRKGFC